MGGLGNQMFQYSMGRALAIRFGTTLLIDTSWYATKTNNTPRDFSLNHFPNLKSTIATSQELDMYATHILWKQLVRKIQADPKTLLPLLWSGILKKWILHLKSPSKSNLFLEPNVFYNSQSENLKGTVYLSGYWQSVKYTEAIQTTLIKDFSFPAFTKHEAHTHAEEMKNAESIALHIRCGDYLLNKRYKRYFNILDNRYYDKAITTIINSISKQANFKLFIFSDEPANVCRVLKLEALALPYSLVNIHNEAEAIHDMHLMSLCKHTIIANSTFSWWAGMLNQNPQKMIICPTLWFANEKMNKRIGDFYPNEWIRIKY